MEQENEIIRFKIPGKAPSKSNAYKIITIKKGKFNHASLAKTKALKEYEKKFFSHFPPQYRNLQLDHFFTIKGYVYYPSNRADLDNSLKIILDCLQKVTGTIKNDNKCMEIHFFRAVDKEYPRIEIELEILKHL
jgi:Holliday junction resolvase RusA-like endonuclease